MGKRTREKYDEDLFKDTTMTFGEHLEELRTCLFKAVLGLAIGFLIGLGAGKYVVLKIQEPLQEALTSHYQIVSIQWIKDKLKEVNGDDEPLPWTAEQIEKIVNEDGLLPEETFIDPVEMLQQVKRVYPKQLENVPIPPDNPEAKLRKSDLMRVFTWRRIEDDTRIQAKTLNAHEAFMIWMKASFLVGVLAASPWIFYQIWAFVAAGLYPHEKRYVHVFLPFSLGLFLGGAALAFFFVFKPVLNFLFGFNRWLGIDPDPRISEWLGFVLILPLGFGIAFQLPLVMLFLERIGIFDVKAYLSRIRIAILLIFVLAMFLTPADPYSMLLMAIPLTVLYFFGILLCKYMPRRRSRLDELED